MKQLKTIDEIKDYYTKEDVTINYESKRFISGVGELMHKNHIKIVNKFVNKVKKEKILEIAPGPARITAKIKVKEGFAIENSDNMLNLARNKHLKNWKFIKGDAFDLKINKKFNLIYTFRFIRHFKLEQRKELYYQIRNKLNINGYFIFDAPNIFIESPWRKIVGVEKYPVFDKFWFKKELIKELEENGFEVLGLVNNINLFFIQEPISKILSKLDIKSTIVEKLEKINLSIPLEWIVICKKK
jgi:ubiquinone/menaquinone biosynthesis C-methylase UbiE